MEERSSKRSSLLLAAARAALVLGVVLVLARGGGRRWLRLAGLCSYLVVVGGQRPSPSLLWAALRSCGDVDAVSPYWGHRTAETPDTASAGFVLPGRPQPATALRP